MAELSPETRALVEQMEAGAKAQADDDFVRLLESFLAVQVCTSLSDEDATARMNLTPSGSSHGWQLTEEPGALPVPCADKPDTHRHLVFEC
jgi:hypothetical protein